MADKDNFPTAQSDAGSKPNDPKEASQPQGAKVFAAHKAHPGPAIPQSMPAPEGTKEELQAKAKDLNK
ncbi:hypothetical protein BX600DRAFT_466017 [Xylariales sp. PMI_506]|nr:hypothetical protein BX600DRAFT_466017 [Xylariales sp. PMI_506]